ncbi:hypothetical protein L0668_03685 [Paraglaciecola aquimarina]|uniref:Pullulanase n=1 Tax=Paraglaciecola algarum TaxID=3050085 RepID=A0ABS9D3I5_9ALTE|nr:hypothetical protein [Paraglaciecola sp. G1-23]MCF2947194.1 hypothetical protein [Paraglaciecola sp. G1-23]
MINLKAATFLALSSLLSGCASTAIETFIQEKDYSGLYLRGVFSWWEADEKYKLVEIANNTYSTNIELIADGQPYDFKFADADWTPGFNCGYRNTRDQIVAVGNTVSADCESTDENFRFTPAETGTYKFTIDFSGFGSPSVLVEFVET